MSATTHRLGNAPSNNAANLIRGLALCAAVAMTLFGPTVLAGRVALDPDVLRFIVTLFTIGAALLALRGRLSAPRSIRAWVFWALGSLVLGAVGAVTLGGAVIYLLIEQGARIALAATAAWAGAVLLNGVEAGRAFRVARTLCTGRHVAYHLSATLLVALSALRVADLALPPLQRALTATVYEGLATGLASTAGVVFALVIGLAAWRVPQALAQRQFDGRLAASAVAESMWFCSLATLLMPLALPEVAIGDPTAPLAGAAWGEVALHMLSVVVAHGLVRLGLGRAGSVPPVPLLVLQRSAAAPDAARRLLARLPKAWGAGPVCRVMPPAAAAAEHGAHLHLAALTGREDLLFPVAAQDLSAWRDALPPWQHWRALATQELYASTAQWRETIDAWANPQTWVVLLEDGAGRPPQAHAGDWADALPEGRSVRVNLGAADDGYWPAALRHLPAWTDDTGSADAGAFAQWLRARVRPEAPRRILLLHAQAEAALASALVAQLDGRADTQGRFVEAWTVGEHGSLDWRMPLDGFRLMAQVQLNHAQARLREGTPGRLERLNLLASAALASTALGLRAQDAPAPYDVVLLHTRALRDAAGRWSVTPQAQPLIRSATRRLALRLDGGDATLCDIDAQIAAPLADPGALDATALRTQATKLAEQILADAWVALAPAQPAVPEAKTTPQATTAGPAFKGAATGATPYRVLLLQDAFDELAREMLQLVDVLLAERTEGRVALEVGGVGSGELLSAAHLARYDAVVLMTTPALLRSVPIEALLGALRDIGRPLWRVALTDAPAPEAIAALKCLSPRAEDGREIALIDASDPADAGGTLRLRADAVALALRNALFEAARTRRAAPPESPESPESPEAPADDAPPLLADLPGAALSLATLTDGTPVAGLKNGQLAWQRPDAPWRSAWAAHQGGVTALLPLPQGRLVSASDDGELLLWEQLPPVTPPRHLGRHDGAVQALALSNDGDWVLSGGADRTLRGFCLAVEAAPRSSPGFAAGIEAIDTDDERIFAACGEARVQTLVAGRAEPSTPEPRTGASTRALTILGDNLFTAGHDEGGRGFVKRSRLRRDGLDDRHLSGLRSSVGPMIVLPDERVAFGCDDGGVWLWVPSQGANAMQQLGSHASRVRAITRLADGRLCTAGDEGSVRLHQVPDTAAPHPA